jgi:hypothetical protein
MDILINVQKNYSQFDLSMANFATGSTFGLLEKEASKKNLNYYEDEKFIGLSRLNNLRSKIQGLVHLESNWDSYNAVIISKTAIAIAIETVNFINCKGLLSTDLAVSVFPMRDGGIQFEFDGENICAELEINHKGDLIFIHFDDEDNIINKGKLFELSELSTLLEEAQYAL